MNFSVIIFSLILFLSPYNIESIDISIVYEDEIAKITEDKESALREAINILNKNGGTIYIDTPVINIKTKDKIKLTSTNPGGIVGIKQANGEYPRIDYKQSRDIGATNRAIEISGSNQFIKYLIIENSGRNGIYILGPKNIIDHVISRYNANSGY